MISCEGCGREMEPASAYTHMGRNLCEECYMDALNPPKACDPWAVYVAKRSASRGLSSLTPLQEKILDILAKEGPMPPVVLQRRLGVQEVDLRREFATLRHMERVKATKIDGEIHYALFDR
ncbi:MAG: hypothetical protein ACUVXD_04875 [Thermodesulfobacteriota bacterium]